MRVVADAGTLWLAVEHEDRRVQLENQTRGHARTGQQATQSSFLSEEPVQI